MVTVWAQGWVYAALLLLTFAEDKRSTELVREARQDERPLLLATLGGGMVAVHQATGETIWRLKDEPVVKVPSQEGSVVPQFLPDPRHGSLYMYGPRPGEPHALKKLPFTIPELVANAPCRSADGFLYTGKKSDTWFLIDPETGFREHVSGFEKTKMWNKESGSEETCWPDKRQGVFLARTEYTVLMHHSRRRHQRWNVTFYDYSSHHMAQDMLSHYGLIHFTSTSNGRVMSFNRQTGDLVWSCTLDTPVVAAYLLDRDGLISVPFNSIGDDTMDHIMEDIKTLRNGHGLKHSNMELFPTLYVGEHNHGLYALTSLVDKNTITISTEQTRPLLLEGPMSEEQTQQDRDNPLNEHYANIHYKINDLDLNTGSVPFLLLGHYKMPDLTTNWLPPVPSGNLLVRDVSYSDQDTSLRLLSAQASPPPDEQAVENETGLKEARRGRAVSVGVQTEEGGGGAAPEGVRWLRPVMLYKRAYVWLHQQENKGLKVALIVLVGLVIAMFWYLQYQAREFQQLSQGGSRGGSSSSGGGGKAGGGGGGEATAQLVDVGDGEMRIGRISFHTDRVLGKGCEGTFVYRGTFDKRAVAVKRLLPECFTFADREVALLRESDAHAHVVRYYCTERDKQFRYIALELCAATLQDYVEMKLTFDCSIDPVEVLRQATLGLAHLHSMDIVHRDIKSHNVLLPVPTGAGEVRAMYSDCVTFYPVHRDIKPHNVLLSVPTGAGEVRAMYSDCVTFYPVHRDIKPHNVLLSVPTGAGEVRAMYSDCVTFYPVHRDIKPHNVLLSVPTGAGEVRAMYSDCVTFYPVHRDIKPHNVLLSVPTGAGEVRAMYSDCVTFYPVHRDIKPHNVLLSVPTGAGEVRAMISDFGLSKKLHVGRTSFSRRSGVTGTDGWIAPEMISGERTTTSVDIFSLGCVFYYVLSQGRHPFGDVLRRQANILSGEYSLEQIETTREEEDVVPTKILIRAMISARPYKRPPCNAVLKHPIFWSPQTRLNFLQDVSDQMEGGGGRGLPALEEGARGVTRGDWRAHVCERIAADLRARRTYRGHSVLDLLRALRNKKHHYRELEAAARESLGRLPDGFLRYWLRRFPLLLPHVWCQMQEHRHEDALHAYYPQAFTYPREDVPELASCPDHDAAGGEVALDPDLERNQLFLKSRDERAKASRKSDRSPRTARPEPPDGVYRHPHYNEIAPRESQNVPVRRKQKKIEDTPAWTLPPQ